MYLRSYKYYLKIYKDLPDFDRGLGFLFAPTVIFLLIAGIVFFPLLFLKGSWLFGERCSKKNETVEFIFGPTHLNISSRLNLEGTNKFFFNMEANYLNLDMIINDKRLLFISLIYGLETGWLLIRSVRKRRIKRNAIRLIKIVAVSKFAKYHFKGHKVFIQYNDHIPYNVMLQQLAKKMHLKTVYIQHAPVSFEFPPLYHDLNVLFSFDSLNKYRRITGDVLDVNRVMVLYDIRFPPKAHLLKGNAEYILLCYNKIDDIAEVDKTIMELNKSNLKVRIRPHPEDNRKVKFSSKIEISTGKSIWEDLALAYSVIVNESAVPLEAIYCDIPVYKLASLSLRTRDNYGFLKTGLLQKEYFSTNELIPDLLSKKNVCDRGKLDYYLGNIDNFTESKIELNNRIKCLSN